MGLTKEAKTKCATDCVTVCGMSHVSGGGGVWRACPAAPIAGSHHSKTDSDGRVRPAAIQTTYNLHGGTPADSSRGSIRHDDAGQSRNSYGGPVLYLL